MKENKKELKLKKLNNIKNSILDKFELEPITDDFLFDFFNKRKIDDQDIIFGISNFKDFSPINGYTDKIKNIKNIIKKDKEKQKLESYKSLIIEKLENQNITNEFWYDFFNKGNIGLKNIVLGISESKFKDFKPIKGYEESILNYNQYKKEKDKELQEHLKEIKRDNELKEILYQKKLLNYKNNNTDDLCKIKNRHLSEIIKNLNSDKLLISSLWNLLEEYNIPEFEKIEIKNLIIDGVLHNIEYEINSFLAVKLFPELTNMLAYSKKIGVVYEDSGYDCSTYPYVKEELHTLKDYKTISDVIENNYEDSTEPTYISGMGLLVPTIDANIYSEIETVYYELIKNILTKNISIDPDKKDNLIFEILNTSFVEYIIFDYTYKEIIINTSIYDLFHIYKDERCKQDYLDFINNI